MRCQNVLVIVVVLLWIAAGITKVAMPTEFWVGSVKFPAALNFALGIAEVLIALALAKRTLASRVATWVTFGLALSLLLHYLWPPQGGCGCLGRLRLEGSQRVFLTSVFMMSTAWLALITGQPTSAPRPGDVS